MFINLNNSMVIKMKDIYFLFILSDLQLAASYAPTASDQTDLFDLQICDFEWRRNVWNISVKNCQGLQERVTFHGR